MAVRELEWVDPAWRAAADAWIEERLAALGLTRTGPIDQVHVRPWSTVMRVPTGHGPVWFKANGALQFFEAALLQVVARRCPRRVTTPLAVDAGRGWLLLEDGGVRLREVLDGDPGLERWARILELYAELQIEVSPVRDELLAAGTPHRPLDSLVPGLEAMLADPAALQLPTEDAVTGDELERLGRQLPRLGEICDRVAALGLPESVNHGDLHDGNMFVRDGSELFFDWGDSSVTHPFFSTVVPMRVLAHKLGIRQLDPRLERVRDAYIEPWAATFERRELRRIYDDAYRLGSLSRLLDHYEHVQASPDLAVEYDYAGQAAVGVRLLLEVLDGRSHVW
jgi:hypothetical protein